VYNSLNPLYGDQHTWAEGSEKISLYSRPKMGGVGGRPKFHFARRVFLDRTSTSSDFQDTNSCRISGTFEIFEADRPPDLFGKRTLVESFYCFYLCVYIYIYNGSPNYKYCIICCRILREWPFVSLLVVTSWFASLAKVSIRFRSTQQSVKKKHAEKNKFLCRLKILG
jgi:hypothetical protein